MILKLLYVLIIFFTSINDLSAQIPMLIHEAATNIFLSFGRNDSLPVPEFQTLKELLNLKVDEIKFEKEFAAAKDNYDSLRDHFTKLESEYGSISTDSSLFLFHQWYLHFSDVFYQYRKKEFLSSGKTKILFFSTSMSCHCALQMCKNQLMEILNFVSRENVEDYDLMVVDTYRKDELQIKFEILFSPSVVVLSRNNKVLLKVEYEKEMIARLTEFLKTNILEE